MVLVIFVDCGLIEALVKLGQKSMDNEEDLSVSNLQSNGSIPSTGAILAKSMKASIGTTLASY